MFYGDLTKKKSKIEIPKSEKAGYFKQLNWSHTEKGDKICF